MSLAEETDARLILLHVVKGALEQPHFSQLAQKPGSTVTLKGVLEYQACTETTCSAPQQVPLSWILGLKPLG